MQNSNKDETNGAAGIRFSISTLILALLAILLVIIGFLWVRNGEIPRLSNNIYLDDAHVHGAVSTVGARLDGRITEMHVQLGDSFNAGDLLVTLQNDSLKAQVHASAHEILQLRLELDRAEVADQIEMQLAEAVLERALSVVGVGNAMLNAAQAEKDLRQSEFLRSKELMGKGLSPEVDIEIAHEAAEAARALAERRQAEVDINRAELGIASIEREREALRAIDRDIIREQIAEAEANLDDINASVGYTRIHALESGKVVEMPARLGDAVLSGDPLINIWRTNQIWVRAWIDEYDLSRIARADRAKVRISSISDIPFTGTVHRILVARDGKTSTLPGEPISPLLPDVVRFAVLVLLDTDGMTGQRLLPGMSAEVWIPLPE